MITQPSLVAQLVKNLPAMWETWVWSPGEGKGYPLQYSGLENSTDCIVHGVAKSQTRLGDFHIPLITDSTPCFADKETEAHTDEQPSKDTVMEDGRPNTPSQTCLDPNTTLVLNLCSVTYYLCRSEVTQLCPSLCNPMDCNLLGSSVHGVLQAGVQEWVAISFSRGSFQSRDWTWVSCIAGRCFTVWSSREAWNKAPNLSEPSFSHLWNIIACLSYFIHVQLYATLWTVVCQAPLSMGFSRQEYWSGLPCPSPGGLPNSCLKLMSLRSPALEKYK